MSADDGIELRVRGDGGLRDLDSAAANRGFCERRPAVFVGPPAPACRLFIDDEPLDLVARSGNEWSWKPGFYAGEVRAELLDGNDRSLGVWRLDVSPDPDKAGRELFARMIDEIVAFDTHLVVGDEPARRRLGAVGKTDDPLVLLARLRRRRRDLDQVLAAIRREPVSVPRARRRFVSLRDVRARGPPYSPGGDTATGGPSPASGGPRHRHRTFRFASPSWTSRPSNARWTLRRIAASSSC